jgi:hypothetical protein
MDLRPHLVSKTNGALILMLGIVVLLSLTDHLTENTVEALKWIGTSFFGVRGISNAVEGFVGGGKDDSSS